VSIPTEKGNNMKFIGKYCKPGATADL